MEEREQECIVTGLEAAARGLREIERSLAASGSPRKEIKARVAEVGRLIRALRHFAASKATDDSILPHGEEKFLRWKKDSLARWAEKKKELETGKG